MHWKAREKHWQAKTSWMHWRKWSFLSLSNLWKNVWKVNYLNDCLKDGLQSILRIGSAHSRWLLNINIIQIVDFSNLFWIHLLVCMVYITDCNPSLNLSIECLSKYCPVSSKQLVLSFLIKCQVFEVNVVTLIQCSAKLHCMLDQDNCDSSIQKRSEREKRSSGQETQDRIIKWRVNSTWHKETENWWKPRWGYWW